MHVGFQSLMLIDCSPAMSIPFTTAFLYLPCTVQLLIDCMCPSCAFLCTRPRVRTTKTWHHPIFPMPLAGLWLVIVSAMSILFMTDYIIIIDKYPSNKQVITVLRSSSIVSFLVHCLSETYCCACCRNQAKLQQNLMNLRTILCW